MYQPLLKELEEKMKKAVDIFENDASKIRGGRASGAIVEDIKVSYYGTMTPLKQLAAINTPDPKMILIQPFDKNALGDIENAIRASELNLNPVNDGSNIRLSLPPLSEERREELIKVVKGKAEEAHVTLKLLRQDTWKSIKDLETEKKITEDDKYSAEEELNKLVARYNEIIDSSLSQKEIELKQV